MLLLHIDNDDDDNDNDNNNSNDNDDDDAARKKIGKTVGPSRRQRPFDFNWQKRGAWGEKERAHSSTAWLGTCGRALDSATSKRAIFSLLLIRIGHATAAAAVFSSYSSSDIIEFWFTQSLSLHWLENRSKSEKEFQVNLTRKVELCFCSLKHTPLSLLMCRQFEVSMYEKLSDWYQETLKWTTIFGKKNINIFFVKILSEKMVMETSGGDTMAMVRLLFVRHVDTSSLCMRFPSCICIDWLNQNKLF